MKFYQTAAFRELQEEWRRRLELADFEDIEDEHGNLKNPDTRTIRWQAQDYVSNYYSWLRSVLSNSTVRRSEAKVLEHVVRGRAQVEIAEALGLSRYQVNRITRKYRKLYSSVR